MRINLLWPRWAAVVAPLTAREIRGRGSRCWETVRRAGVLLADLADYQQIARLRRARPGARASVRPDVGARWMMALLAALVLPLLIPAPAAAEKPDKWFVALQAAGAADLVSTELWLRHDPWLSSDGRWREPAELNPLGQHLAGRIALKAGLNTLSWWGAKKLEENGHSRWANVVRWSALSYQCGLAGWNVSLTVSPR